MGRLRARLEERTERFAHRVVDVAEAVAEQRRSFRIVDQMIGSGASVGANTAEAGEAVSRKDFCKSVGTVLKELNETRFWIRFVASRAWLESARLAPLEGECDELKRVFGTILARVRSNDKGRGA